MIAAEGAYPLVALVVGLVCVVGVTVFWAFSRLQTRQCLADLDRMTTEVQERIDRRRVDEEAQQELDQPGSRNRQPWKDNAPRGLRRP